MKKGYLMQGFPVLTYYGFLYHHSFLEVLYQVAGKQGCWLITVKKWSKNKNSFT